MAFEVTPETYLDVFERHPAGAAVLEDLTKRFASRGAVVKGGIDAVLQTYRRAGNREVIDWIGDMLDAAVAPKQPQGGNDA